MLQLGRSHVYVTDKETEPLHSQKNVRPLDPKASARDHYTIILPLCRALSVL